MKKYLMIILTLLMSSPAVSNTYAYLTYRQDCYQLHSYVHMLNAGGADSSFILEELISELKSYDEVESHLASNAEFHSQKMLASFYYSLGWANHTGDWYSFNEGFDAYCDTWLQR